VLWQQLHQRTAGCRPATPTRTPAEPGAGQLQFAEQGPKDDSLPIFDAASPTAGLAGRPRSQERSDLTVEDLSLDCQQDRLGLSQRQTQLLEPLVVLIKHDQFVDGRWLVIISDNHELKLEP